MLYIGICELLKHWKQTLLMALQIGIIMFLTLVAVTTYRYQAAKYSYIKDFLHKDGALISVHASDINDAGGVTKYFDKYGVDEYHCEYQSSLFLDEEYSKKFNLYAYDGLLSQYKPELSEGVWYTKVEDNENVIEAVVSKNHYGIGLGDTVEMYTYRETLTVHICGVLAEEASFYGVNSLSIQNSFFDLYRNFVSEREDTDAVILVSAEAMEDAGHKFVPSGNVLVSFKEDISEDAKKRSLSKWGNTSVVIEFETLTEKTEGEIARKMSEIMPVFIGAFFLVILSITCFSAIDTLTSAKSYAVFFACGMEWKKGVYINAIKSIITCLIGAVVMFLLHYISILTKLSDTILFEFGPWQILACVLVCLFMVAVSCIMPRQLLKNNQPAEVLRDSRQ